MDRVDWMTKMDEWKVSQWQKVVFLDEKKLNLDGPDRLACHRNSIGKYERVVSKREGRVKV